MLALHVSIPCEGRGLQSWRLRHVEPVWKSCNQRACHRVVSATGRWEVKGYTAFEMFITDALRLGG